MLRPLFALLAALATFVAVTVAAGPLRPRLIEHDEAYPYTEGEARFDELVRAKQPRIVALGSSVMASAFNESQFEAAVGIPTLDLTIHGSMSAIWYLLFKNLVAEQTPPPKIVLIGFRDVYLTVPQYRVEMPYKGTIDRFVRGEEPVLDRLAYFRDVGSVEYFLKRRWTVFQRRAELRQRAELAFKQDLVGALLGERATALEGGAKGAIDRVFSEDNKIPELVSAAQGRAEQVIDPKLFDFADQMPRSFLPEIVRIAEERGIQLILVRLRPRRNAEHPVDRSSFPGWVHELLPGYERDFAAYIEQHGIPLLDFAEDARIGLDWYANGDHLNTEPGEVGFTRLLVEAVQPYLDAAR